MFDTGLRHERWEIQFGFGGSESLLDLFHVFLFAFHWIWVSFLPCWPLEAGNCGEIAVVNC